MRCELPHAHQDLLSLAGDISSSRRQRWWGAARVLRHWVRRIGKQSLQASSNDGWHERDVQQLVGWRHADAKRRHRRNQHRHERS